MLLHQRSSMSTQFVKSPPTPADSKLWRIGKKWRRSQKTGVDYTDFDQIGTTHADVDIEGLIGLLRQQYAGTLKQSINCEGHRLVGSYSQDGKPFVYGYPANREAEAEKKASYNNGPPLPEEVGGLSVPTTTATAVSGQQTFKPQASNTATSSTATISTSNKPTITRQSLEVPFDLRPIKWNDVEAIQDALNDGLYPLPVKHTGVENWGYIGEMSGERTFWYGRIKLIEVD